MRTKILALTLLVMTAGAQAQEPKPCPEGPCSLLPSSDAVTLTNASAPHCPPGHQLVLDLMMRPKCAKDLIEPTR